MYIPFGPICNELFLLHAAAGADNPVGKVVPRLGASGVQAGQFHIGGILEGVILTFLIHLYIIN